MILPKEASKIILILNNNIPEDQKRLWVTIPEIRDRLVAAGVDRNLSDDHVLHAITRFNKDVFLTRWHDSGVAYYRSPEYVYECPHQQRWKESGLPDRTTTQSILHTAFKWNDTCRKKLHMLNKVLVGLDNNIKQQKKLGEDKKSKVDISDNSKTTSKNTSGLSNNNDIKEQSIRKTTPSSTTKLPPIQNWSPKQHDPSYAFTLVPPPSTVPMVAAPIQYSPSAYNNQQQTYNGYWTPWQLDAVSFVNEGPPPFGCYNRYWDSTTNQYWNYTRPPPPPPPPPPPQPRMTPAAAEAMIEMASESPDFGMLCETCDLPPDSIRLVRTSNIINFIREATLHASKCGCTCTFQPNQSTARYYGRCY